MQSVHGLLGLCLAAGEPCATTLIILWARDHRGGPSPKPILTVFQYLVADPPEYRADPDSEPGTAGVAQTVKPE